VTLVAKRGRMALGRRRFRKGDTISAEALLFGMFRHLMASMIGSLGRLASTTFPFRHDVEIAELECFCGS